MAKGIKPMLTINELFALVTRYQDIRSLATLELRARLLAAGPFEESIDIFPCIKPFIEFEELDNPVLHQLILSLPTVTDNDVTSMKDCLVKLETHHLLTQEIFDLISNNPERETITAGFIYLNAAKLLDRENMERVVLSENAFDPSHAALNIIINYYEMDNLLRPLIHLYHLDLLTRENFEAVIENPLEFSFALDALVLTQNISETPMLYQDVLNKLRNDIAQHQLGRLLAQLFAEAILTPQTFFTIVHNHHHVETAQALMFLHAFQILDQSALQELQDNDEPEQYAFSRIVHAYEDNFALCTIALTLLSNHVLTQQNIQAILRHPRIEQSRIRHILDLLHMADLVTQDNLNLLFMVENRWLLSEEANEIIWQHVEVDMLDQHFFANLIQHLGPPNTVEIYLQETLQFRAILRQLNNHITAHLQRLQNIAIQRQFNPTQSTHTASVHQTVSESARRLQSRYGAEIPDDVALREIHRQIHNDLLGLPESHLTQAAIRAFRRITAEDYEFVDPESRVSTRMLIALCFVAIQDNIYCHATLDDARDALVHGLYEIQRGDNINELNEDDMLPEDASICEAGTFNKLINSLEGLHEDCRILYISYAAASEKFPIFVRHAVVDHLLTRANPATEEEYHTIRQLIIKIRNEGVECIRTHIQGPITAAILDEYHNLFTGEDDPRLQSLFDYMEEIEINEHHLITVYRQLADCEHLTNQRRHTGLPRPSTVIFAQNLFRPIREDSPSIANSQPETPPKTSRTPSPI